MNRRLLVGVGGLFLVNGTAVATWVSRIPARQESLGLDERGLGLVLLGLAAGTVGTLPVAGGLVGRFGARIVTAAGLALMVLALPLPALAGDAPTLFGALVVLGAGIAAMDVGMNAQGVVSEREAGRSVMVGLHGMWSVGGLVGTGVGSLVIAAGVGTAVHLVAGTVVLGVAGGLATVLAWPAAGASRKDAPKLAWPRGPLWPLAAIALVSALGEGSVADWAGVHLRQATGASEAATPLGFLVFSVTMAGARFGGDRLAMRFGPRTVVRAGGLLAAVGFLVAAAAPSVAVALTGFALVGAGLAPVVPLAFAAAGRVEGISEGEGVAAVSTIGYSGFLAGPPLIGFVADAIGLSGALALVGAGVLVLPTMTRGLKSGVSTETS